ncbi:tRNA (guanosine(46)-N7)-methyltransferase TrmB [Malaciobacter molluscorum LMG 25693]|uniref:tRNA (guanine-N(7)-)-methyltransferase n=1 Tax=Malaciobacter molluscorum LMG 25693 TaxID=870501 RepID=A0A2G1DLV6_9BACT|nr:tRNA (guanosine(46)-N7)-methyltransferase TrmB [Malaciobacter molluscorum]AXX92098.1 tRNA m7G46 methyltransferase [Malaciobacter molluscorum LMG 25693]PHO19326.1 tRNA (guanosine(46)-N7)-methyltransferase TrmB [Malaciobacter molluscorum LMG 25693]
MPHIVFNNDKEIKIPFEKNGVSFTFMAKSYNFTEDARREEYKIGVNYDNKDFLLTLKNKDENKMLKFDKVTRVTPITLVKDALNAYVEAIDANVVFSNTNSFNQKVEPKKEYLKDINYFVNEFKTDKEIQIEIGFGSGRHLLYQAKNNPDVQFIGLEIHTPSIEQLLKQLKIQNITNVLVVNYDARLFMEFINSNKVGKIFVHFPVPWDKKPHRRIYSNEFIDEALRVLKIDGTLELRTDSRKYFDYCIDLLTNLNSGRITVDINKDLEVSSKYEDRWKKQGKNIYDVVLQCQKEDKKINLKHDFSFGKIDLENFKKNMTNKPMVDENFFIHIEDLFLLEEENSALIQVTLGSFNRPLSKFIFVKNNIAHYLQGNPLPTSANIKAHERLKEILK